MNVRAVPKAPAPRNIPARLRGPGSWLCHDCGADLHQGVSWMLKGKQYCQKHYGIRKGIRDKNTGRLLSV